MHICVFNLHNSQNACSIIQTWGEGTVDLNIHIYYIPPFFELLGVSECPTEVLIRLNTSSGLKGLCQLESMRSEVMQITFNCQTSIVLTRDFLHVRSEVMQITFNCQNSIVFNA